jgi:hypothetical protein
MRTTATLVQTRTLAELGHMQKGEWCGGANVNEEDKMPLFFLEIVYADEESRLVGRSKPN